MHCLEEDKIKITLFESFPREIGQWKKWCESYDEYKEYVKRCNGVLDCYCSVYKQTSRANRKEIGDAVESGAIVDKVYLDMDSSWGFEAMQIAHEMLEERNILHRVNASGRWGGSKVLLVFDDDGKPVLRRFKIDASYGFHVYFWILPDFENKKNALYNVQKHFCEEMCRRLKTGYGVDIIDEQYVTKDGERLPVNENDLSPERIYYPADRKIWGDVLRISRIPNTWNPKRKRFCIPLDDYMIKELSANDIQEIAKKQAFFKNEDIYFGQKMARVPSEFDVKSRAPAIQMKDIPEDFNPDKDVLEKINLPVCIKNLLANRYLGNDKRFWLLVYLRDVGVSMEEASLVLSSHLSPEFAYDSLYVEKQPERVYRMKQRQTMMRDCFFMSKLVDCKNQCPECYRYGKRHPIYR